MRNLILSTAAAAAVAIIFIAPAQAASRYVEFSSSSFSNRCESQSGQVTADAGGVLCRTAETAVACDFIEQNLAVCQWAGIDHQTAVDRIIGMASAASLTDADGGPAKAPRWNHKVIKF